MPLRQGYAELLAGWDGLRGGWARGQAGLHLAPGLSAFAFGEVDQVGAPQAGAGVRYDFRL